MRKATIITLAILAVSLFILPARAQTVDYWTWYKCARDDDGKILGVGGLGYLFDVSDAFDHAPYWTMILVYGDEDTWIEAGMGFYNINGLKWFSHYCTYKDNGEAVSIYSRWPGDYTPGNWETVMICRDKYDPSLINWHVFIGGLLYCEVNFTNSGVWEGESVSSTLESWDGIADYENFTNRMICKWESLSYLEAGTYGNWMYWGSPGYSTAEFEDAAPDDMWAGMCKEADAQYGYGTAYHTYIPNIQPNHIRWFKDEHWTVNYLTAHRLEEFYDSAGASYTHSRVGTFSTVSFAFKVWRRNTSGVEQELSLDEDGQPVYLGALTKPTYFGLSYFLSNWTPPFTRIQCSDGDNLVFRLFMRFDSYSWTYVARWQTEQIYKDGNGLRYLEPVMWWLGWFVECTKVGTTSYAKFYVDDSTQSYIDLLTLTCGENEGSLLGYSSPSFNVLELFKRLSGY